MKTVYSETATINYSEYVQDTINMEFAYTDSQGNLIDMTLYDLVAEIRQLKTDTTALLTYSSTSGTIIVNQSADYNINFTITDAQTLSLGARAFYYFLKLTKKSTGFVNTLVVGTLKLQVR